MIVRSWHGETTRDNADAYVRHLETTILPGIRNLAGHRGTYVLKRSKGDGFEFLVLTLWDSLEAVERFAGPELDRAVVPPEAETLLSRFDERVSHYDVILSP